jgi:hypothetical protein
VVLLDVDVKHHRCRHPPILLVLIARRRETLRCHCLDDVDSVRRPNDIGVCQAVNLPDEVGVRPHGLLCERELHNIPRVSCVNQMKIAEKKVRRMY